MLISPNNIFTPIIAINIYDAVSNSGIFSIKVTNILATPLIASIPKTAPKNDAWDIAFEFIPMSGVSGDLYDFYVSEGEITGLTLCDVSGHGIASGLVTMIARSVFFRNFSKWMTI